VKKRSYDKQTAVHRAAYYGNTKILKIISASIQLSFSKKDKRGNTPLHYASQKFNIQTIRYLLEKTGKEGLKVKNNDGNSPLHLLVKNLEKIAKRRPYEYEVNKKDIKLYLEDKEKMPFPIHTNVKKPIVSIDSDENDSVTSKPASIGGSDPEHEPRPDNGHYYDDDEAKRLMSKKKRKHNIKKSKKHSIFGGQEAYQIQELVVNPNLDLNNLAMENLVNGRNSKGFDRQISKVSGLSGVGGLDPESPELSRGAGRPRGEFGMPRNRKRSEEL
jgi:hypothetical protein